ncbi:MAG: bile acid:sodium symporter family protein [Brucellaceae bacterium]|nr:bile acid:sodium symporter family protein [Brucellaceae bacterium]
MSILISILLPVALITMMMSLGLGLAVSDFARIARHPKSFAAGALTQLIIVPTLAFIFCRLFQLEPEIALGLMILSLCPGGPTSNIMSRAAHGDVALSITLNGTSSLLALVTLPLMTAWFAPHFLGADAPPIRMGTLGLSMFLMTTLPVVTGMLLRRYLPRVADALDKPFRKASSILLVVVVGGGLASNWRLFADVLPSLGPCILLLGICFLISSLTVCRLAGLDTPQTTAITIDTGIQNAALGITVGTLIAGSVDTVPPISFPSGVYAVVMYGLVIPFMFWRRRVAENAYSAATAVRA